MSLEDAWEVPEFSLPVRLEFDHIIPLREQRCIARAATHAHLRQHRAAHEYRTAAGYGGCDDNDPRPFATL